MMLRHSIPKSIRPMAKASARAFGRLTSAARVLPDFLIVGEAKCGTTTLFWNLVRHPQIGAALEKEVGFFSYYYDKGPRWYRAHFPTIWSRGVARRRRGGTFLLGEATPTYFGCPEAPERVRRLVPDAKIVVALRNPVERAYSHYQHAVRKGFEQLSFEEAVSAEEVRIQEIRESTDPALAAKQINRIAYVTRGIYVDNLVRWFKSFGRERVYVIAMERFSQDPDGELTRLSAVLGASGWNWPTPAKWNSGSYSAMSSHTRQQLSEFYAPHNEQLETCLGWKIGW